MNLRWGIKPRLILAVKGMSLAALPEASVESRAFLLYANTV